MKVIPLRFNKNKTAPQPWQAIAQRFCSIGICKGVKLSL